ncbi:hypothetical protein WJX81_003726 [Elliptochloris bilobata]|uniref:Uncharacterized protein n=1 Tax=Elliptochloris bilobata TaxID=381761 RepID=A0AAW1RB01_9CHLO
MSSFLNGLKGLKLKELSPYVAKHAREHWTPAQIAKRSKTFLHEYKDKHIDTGSVWPLFHTMGIIFVGAYILAYPQEMKHYRAEMQAKLDKELGKEPAHR